jgi:hypothetical protein
MLSFATRKSLLDSDPRCPCIAILVPVGSSYVVTIAITSRLRSISRPRSFIYDGSWAISVIWTGGVRIYDCFSGIWTIAIDNCFTRIIVIVDDGLTRRDNGLTRIAIVVNDGLPRLGVLTGIGIHDDSRGWSISIALPVFFEIAFSLAVTTLSFVSVSLCLLKLRFSINLRNRSQRAMLSYPSGGVASAAGAATSAALFSIGDATTVQPKANTDSSSL